VKDSESRSIEDRNIEGSYRRAHHERDHLEISFKRHVLKSRRNFGFGRETDRSIDENIKRKRKNERQDLRSTGKNWGTRLQLFLRYGREC